MIKGSKNEELYRSHLAKIELEGARQAYVYLIGCSSVMLGYECFPSTHGVISDFQYHRGDEWPFAFIPNKKWLLFYFRKASQKDPKFSREAIGQRFPEAEENNKGEYKVRIACLEQAIQLNAFITR